MHPVNGTITHRAEVTRVFPQAVEIVVVSRSACDACRVKRQCGMGESREKRMIVGTTEASFFEPGEIVEVQTERSMGIKAVFFAYIFPFLFIFSLLLAMLHNVASEPAAGLSALGAGGCYYFVLYLLRHKIEKEITFKVRKLQ